jgi:hypothetical protein
VRAFPLAVTTPEKTTRYAGYDLWILLYLVVASSPAEAVFLPIRHDAQRALATPGIRTSRAFERVATHVKGTDRLQFPPAGPAAHDRRLCLSRFALAVLLSDWKCIPDALALDASRPELAIVAQHHQRKQLFGRRDRVVQPVADVPIAASHASHHKRSLDLANSSNLRRLQRSAVSFKSLLWLSTRVRERSKHCMAQQLQGMPALQFTGYDPVYPDKSAAGFVRHVDDGIEPSKELRGFAG